MKIYITTNWNQLEAKVLQTISNLENNKGIDSLSIDNPVLYFCDFTKEFKKDKIEECNVILILDENYSEVIRANTITSSDYLLHHTKPDGLDYSDFVNKKAGKHELHDDKYPPVFKIIFDDENEKAKRIIEFLFGRVKFQIAYRELYRSITLAYIKQTNENDNSDDIAIAKTQLSILSSYFTESSEIQIPKEGSPDKIYEYLKANHSVIEGKLFD